MLSGSNYLIFLLFFKQLSTEEFIGFSTAVALNMIAYAIAEGGVSYVAPRELANNTLQRRKISSSFLLIGNTLYIISLLLGFHIWNFVSTDHLDIQWVFAYALFFSPTLLMPPWLTSWSISITEVFILGAFRAVALLLVFFQPDVFTVIYTGLIYLLISIGILFRLNQKTPLIGLPDWTSSRNAVISLWEVFFSKTSSYAIYSTTPMVVSSIYGSHVASLYITGERLKSMYSTVFYPIIQSIYLSNFQKETKKSGKFVFTFVFIINLIISSLLIIAITSGFLNQIIDRFANIHNLWIYVVAAFFSVVTASLLFFIVLPNGDYKIFRKSTYFQLGSFLVLFSIMSFYPVFSPEYVLLLGEAAILLAIIFQLVILKNKKS